MSALRLVDPAPAGERHLWRATSPEPDDQLEYLMTTTPRAAGEGVILVIDDSLVARRYLESVLVKSEVCTKVYLADSVKRGFQVLQAREIDLVLCDLNMPDINGIEFLHLMTAEHGDDLIPVIMLTGEVSVEAKVECLESGASDYLVKPFAEAELIARTRVHLQLKALQDELRIRNQQLKQIACLDSLTGICNRHYFLQRLEHELNRAGRRQLPLSVGMIDIDHFKKINDQHGHVCGDRALIQTASLLKAGLRDYDLLGRYGGEEFVAVFTEAESAVAVEIAERCRMQVAANPMQIGDARLEITVSIGVASTSDPRPAMLPKLIASADEALYLAKNRGRNRVVSAKALTWPD